MPHWNCSALSGARNPLAENESPRHTPGGSFYPVKLELLPGIVVVVEHKGAVVAAPEH